MRAPQSGCTTTHPHDVSRGMGPRFGMTSVTPFPARILNAGRDGRCRAFTDEKVLREGVCSNVQLMSYKHSLFLSCCIPSRWTGNVSRALSYRAHLHSTQPSTISESEKRCHYSGYIDICQTQKITIIPSLLIRIVNHYHQEENRNPKIRPIRTPTLQNQNQDQR